MKKMMKILFVLLGIGVLFFNLTEVNANESRNFSDKKKIAYRNAKKFINNKMVGNFGIYTNYLEGKTTNKKEATGHQYLSESSGLYLLNLAYSNNKREFIKFYNITKRNFYHDGVFIYRLDINHRKKYQVNATIDDLRIIKALLIYDQIHRTNYYQSESEKLFKNLKEKVESKSYLVDYYSISEQKKSKNVTLSYQDVQLLKKFDRKLYKKSLKLVKNGFISKKVPLYQQSYSLVTKKYDTKEIVTAQCLLTMEHLAEVHKLPVASQKWLIKKVKRNCLYNVYNYKGVAIDKNKAASNYALAAIIGKTLANEKLYRESIKELLAFQVKEPSSKIFGSFGDVKTNQVYSFNELLALLALSNTQNNEFNY
ncbi:glycoside hydrolase family 8 [Liquorilactobacillus mali]|uniref:glycoside hydrolase family 8 n=1 Tax=Liquorilactobacillus mali TaxID=1618 RepID=UPI0039EA08A3